MRFISDWQSERDAGPIPAIPEGPCAYVSGVQRCRLTGQPTFWAAYRFSFELNNYHYQKIKLCSQNFKALANNEPEMDLLATGRLLRVKVLDAELYAKLYNAPGLDNIRFSTRALIEGLIAHGILQPGQVLELWQELQRVAVAPGFQERILESLYTEERIRNPKKIIEGELGGTRWS